jgi:hypothetical protein
MMPSATAFAHAEAGQTHGRRAPAGPCAGIESRPLSPAQARDRERASERGGGRWGAFTLRYARSEVNADKGASRQVYIGIGRH